MDDEQDFTKVSQSSNGSPGFSFGHGEFTPGTIVAGRYKILDKLGEGGMAVVYLVEQIFLNDTLALKVLTSGLSDTSTVRFQKEAKVCRLLEHPNLIKVIDFALLENDSPYLVMEFIDGETLADVLRRRGQLSEGEAVDIFEQVLNGVAYAHAQNVVHRDLKPSNIMLFQGADKQLNAKILDFGIAKITGKDNLNTLTLTGTGEIFGSPLFMSPEQCMGRSVDFRSDLYSIGCALYQVLTGAPPFTGDSALATMMLHLEGQPLSLKQASLGKEFSPGIEKVVLKLLQKLPEDRYQSARDVRDDLLAIKSHRAPTRAETVSAKTSASEPKTKVSPAVLAMIAFCVLLAAGSIAVLTIKRTDNNQNSAPAAKPIVSKPLGPYFVRTPLNLYRGGSWVLDFPNQEKFGKVALADLNLNLEYAFQHSVPAEGIVAFSKASPLFFSTTLVYMRPEEFLRFRRDEVVHLRLDANEIRDNAVEIAATHFDLHALALENCWNLTSACLNSIEKMRNLEYLQINTPRTDMDMARLGRIIANSKIKHVIGKVFDHTDEFCEEISKSKTLVSLNLDQCDVSQKGIQAIARIESLQDLELTKNANINTKSMEELLKLKNLKAILISETQVSPDCIYVFKKFPRGCRLIMDDMKGWLTSDKVLFQKTFPNKVVP